MSDVTVRMSKDLRDRLETLSAATRRSKTFLSKEAIQHYVETEEVIVLGIKCGLADVKAGCVVSHGTAMQRIRSTIDKSVTRKKTA